MNFLAHGHRWLDRPDRLAGTALPDWLALLAPASRLRGRALGLPDREDRSARAEVLRGVRIHHAEDRWFHQQPAFEALLREGTAALRAVHPQGADERRFKPRFLAHVAIEVLLDAWLLEREPGLGAAWREALAHADLAALEATVAHHAPAPAPGLAARIAQLRTSAYAEGYGEADEIARRLARVAERVGVRTPPAEATVLAVAMLRPRVAGLGPALLPPPWPARLALRVPD
ncbi:MAG: hypothetical protein AB7T63_06215 [Planctomycetota bacterium]